ncbi:hypothetical protein GCM10009809_03120 [Isoptericola hypogeus]|uniref:Uncharacterized protein n=1 Tax=Isoptericola hypogeus TaxID=300179 RepID=A0ABN2IRP3_9MICO
MKRIIGTAVAAVLLAGAGLAPAATAAVPSNVVTSAEFNKVAYGNSIDYVRSTFGNNGKVVDRQDPAGTAGDYVRVEFPTYYKDGTVAVEFLRRTSGTWYLVSKYASWGNRATRTADKATEAEFNKVKQGNSIDYVRSAFGTNGTIVQTFEAPGTEFDFVALEWPTASTDGWVQVLFVKSSSGTWKVETRAAYWDVAPKRTTNKATESEFNKVKPGNSIDHARSTFGTAGTIDYYYDAPGSVDDQVRLLWPTESPDGVVYADFVKTSTGTWKVERRFAYWDRVAEPTTNVATQAEYESLTVGDTLAQVRGTFGTAGTVAAYLDEPGTAEDLVDVVWYTGAGSEDVFITFMKNAWGEWSIGGADYMSGPWTGDAAPQARAFSAGPETAEPRSSFEQEAPARPSWDLRDAR